MNQIINMALAKLPHPCSRPSPASMQAKTQRRKGFFQVRLASWREANRIVTIQHHLTPAKSLLLGVSGENVGGMAVLLHPCNHGIGASLCGRCRNLRHTWMYQCRVRQDAGNDQRCIYGIFRKIRPIAGTISYVLNSYTESLFYISFSTGPAEC